MPAGGSPVSRAPGGWDTRWPLGRQPVYGQRVHVRFDHRPEPLAVQWYRSLRRLFLTHFNV